jgi:phosphoribosyl 1,2-cyclic phosphodiesterase
MSLYFQSICSSSSGNCLTLWSNTTRLVIDCGLSSMKRTRQMLMPLMERSRIDAVLLTHVHSDHISYYPLRALEEMGLAIYICGDCIEQLKEQHFNDYGFKHLKLHPFGGREFCVGDFLIRPFEVSHQPRFPTFGFEIFHRDTKTVIATDFNQWENVLDKFIDADFIFVESNHDLKLLERYYNPNSRFHLPNPDTAQLLVNVVKEGRKIPRLIVLGHISDQRNRPPLAILETERAFRKAKVEIKFELSAAPLREAGKEIQIV